MVERINNDSPTPFAVAAREEPRLILPNPETKIYNDQG